MKRGSLFGTGDGIVDSDGDDVAPVGFDCGAGKLAVDEEDIFLVAVWCYSASRNRKVVKSSLIWTGD